MVFTVQDCEKRLRLLYETEEKVLISGKSYAVDGMSLQRVDLSEIRQSIALWEQRLAIAKQNGRSRRRTMRIVPRDL